jgi:rhodanese-related sulfurtransferase
MVTYVEADFVHDRLREGRALLVNVLPPEQFDQKRIPGSVNVPVDSPGFEERVRQLAPDKDQPIIVHCSGLNSAASTRAARRLQALGYSEAYDFKAGLEGWAQAGHDFESGGHGETRPGRPERPERRAPARPERAPTGPPAGRARQP